MARSGADATAQPVEDTPKEEPQYAAVCSETARSAEHRDDAQDYGIRRRLLSFMLPRAICKGSTSGREFSDFFTAYRHFYLCVFRRGVATQPPSLGPGRRKTLVLDLDETLVHTSTSFDVCGAGGQAHNNTTAPEASISPSATQRACFLRAPSTTCSRFPAGTRRCLTLSFLRRASNLMRSPSSNICVMSQARPTPVGVFFKVVRLRWAFM